MKTLLIILLLASVAWAGNDQAGFIGPLGYSPLPKCKTDNSYYKWNSYKSEWVCWYECIGAKVYEPPQIKTTLLYEPHYCLNYICEGNGYEGKDCFEDGKSAPESRYEQLKKIWGK